LLTAKHAVTREAVIRFYAAYDRRKKEKQLPCDINEWPWDDPDDLDLRLSKEHLKPGVLAAYRTWRLVVFDITDLLGCAIVNGIIPKESQTLSQLVLRGKVAEWHPDRDAEWWPLIKNGGEIDVAQALVARPSVASEAPASWYLEDGSGRALAVLQRALRYGEVDRTVWVYLGSEPDVRSAFIRSHPELAASTGIRRRS
jgi:hypothetical protein